MRLAISECETKTCADCKTPPSFVDTSDEDGSVAPSTNIFDFAANAEYN